MKKISFLLLISLILSVCFSSLLENNQEKIILQTRDENEQPRQEELTKEEEPQKDEEEPPKEEEQPKEEEEPPKEKEEEKERERLPKPSRIHGHHNRRRYHKKYERRYSKHSMKRPRFEIKEDYKRPYRRPKFYRKNKFNNEERYRRGGRNIWKRREERKTDYVGEHFGKKRFIQRRNRGSERTKKFGNRGYYMKRRNRFN